ncbi:MAG: heavy metal translocating P-type ATPase [Candidatus Gastranaerophilaceae bacterium]|jgi:Cd2+/Zn2+-exporting ATPase|nr:heavy metal translocating P-type ATPase [Christensenellales bacterium]
MSSKQKKSITRIAAGAALLAAAMLLPLEGWLRLLPFLAAYLTVGGGVLMRAGRNILNGQVFDENFLMSIATIGAFAVGEYAEGVVVMLFSQIGQLFESYAVGRSRESIASLMNIRPDSATVLREGRLITVDPYNVGIGEIIVVEPGEKIPLDGIVRSGASSIDSSALTGESLPRDIVSGSEALSGCINLTGVLEIEVTKEFGESTVSKILELVENAASKKAKTENFITKFARYYTPCVVAAAVLLAVVPPLIFSEPFSGWINRALIFLVISCPCALVISVPLSFYGGIGGASKRGILIKGSNYLEALSKTEMVVMDKTGTLTKGTFSVESVNPVDISAEKLLEYAALAESYSNHPISASLIRAYGRETDLSRVSNARESAGHGVMADVDGLPVLAGNAKLMKEAGVDCSVPARPGTAVHVAVDGRYAGYILIADEIKEDAKNAVEEMRKAGVKKTVMLTGDAGSVAVYIAGKLGIDEVHSELLPADKLDQVERLGKETSKEGKLAFVGDGINDAPVLSQADIGIAMGGLGSDAAIEAADIVIMDDRPSKIPVAIRISRKTMRIVWQNIIFSLAVKAAVLALGAVGIATMWEAVFADVGVSVIAILNAVRLIRGEKTRV